MDPTRSVERVLAVKVETREEGVSYRGVEEPVRVL